MKIKLKKFFFYISIPMSFFFIREVISTIKDSQLALDYMTHQMCSCLFSMNHNEKYCKSYVKNQYLSPRMEINYKEKKIKSSIYELRNSEIYHQNEYFGCSFPKKHKT